MLTGSCLCGAVAYEISKNPETAVACHCTTCRKTSGHFTCSIDVDQMNLSIISDETLTWFDSSSFARRGFCNICGSSLFGQINGEGSIAVECGTLEQPTAVRLASHMFVKSKGDYYDIADVLPQREAE